MSPCQTFNERCFVLFLFFHQIFRRFFVVYFFQRKRLTIIGLFEGLWAVGARFRR